MTTVARGRWISAPGVVERAIGMKPKLSRPKTRSRMNHVLSSSCDALSTAPIQATNWPMPPPTTATRRTCLLTVISPKRVGS